MTNYNELRDGQEFYASGYKQGYEDAKKELARSVGKWHCSICQQIVKDMPTVMGKANFNYCPNCGARMEDRYSKYYDLEKSIKNSVYGEMTKEAENDL